MKKIALGKIGPISSAIALGCMRLKDMKVGDVGTLIETALENGINLFDHADIYGAGYCEEIFGKAHKEFKIPREKMVIQSKCGIERGPQGPNTSFNFGYDYIIKAVEGSIKRLECEYLDILALHRPDTLVDPTAVAEAFDNLYTRGLVRYFGVSNQNPMETELLQQATPHKLIVNQLQFGPAHTPMIDINIYANRPDAKAMLKEGEILNYSRINKITIQAWSPFAISDRSKFFFDDEKYAELNGVINQLAQKYELQPNAIATAWILRHPAEIQVIVGTTKPQRIKEIAKASSITLTHKEWYDIYKAAGNQLP
ncbi:MAG: aldo/keto reductase [Defluviitaleaceae bacterium]|nr:aldo/keto reductase [Defluviitaleaceae bacterium]